MSLKSSYIYIFIHTHDRRKQIHLIFPLYASEPPTHTPYHITEPSLDSALDELLMAKGFLELWYVRCLSDLLKVDGSW